MNSPVFSPLFLADLVRIKKEVFLASKEEETAKRYVNELLDRISKRALTPLSGSRVSYKDIPAQYYFLRFKAHLIFYRVENEKMYVDRALFGKSNDCCILFPLVDSIESQEE